ncbi:protein sax-3-like [Sycon ciliatum]|uniref:protein sax-3-like n=1 Tax=Sycon ciliatum TaxID=27933 RepID=UPI0031F6F5F2
MFTIMECSRQGAVRPGSRSIRRHMTIATTAAAATTLLCLLCAVLPSPCTGQVTEETPPPTFPPQFTTGTTVASTTAPPTQAVATTLPPTQELPSTLSPTQGVPSFPTAPEMSGPPLFSLFILQGPPANVDLLRGDYFLFTCVAGGFVNQPTFEWQLDGSKVDSSVDNSFTVWANGSMLFWARSSKFTGSLECVVKSNDGPTVGDALSTPCTLNVIPIDNRFTSNPASITVSHGKPIHLNCSIKSTPTAVITWTRNGASLQSEGSANVTISMVGDTSHLRVASAQYSDDGDQWQCTAINPTASGQISVASLVATVSVRGRPIFTTKPALPSHIHTGDTLTVGCRADGRPVPALHWTQPPLHTVITANTTRLTVTDTRLVLTSVVSGDSGRWSCVASNSYGRESVDFQVTVLPPSDSARISTPPSDQMALVGSTVQLHCTGAGNPLPHITWRKDGAQLDLTSTAGIQWQPGTGTLTLTQVTASASGLYACTATNSQGTESASARVTVAGSPVITPALSNRTVTSGTSLSVTCTTSPSSKLLSTTAWWINGRRISTAPTLTFSPVMLSHSGKYRCDLSTVVGMTSGSLYINVQETPTFVKPPANITVLQGASAMLPCNAMGVPSPTLSWVQGHSTVTTNQHISILSDNTLQIVNADIKNTGVYSCVASNAAGTKTVSASVVVIGRISFTTYPTDTTVIAGRSVRLLCAARADNAVLTYTWYYPNNTRITSTTTSGGGGGGGDGGDGSSAGGVAVSGGTLTLGGIDYSQRGRYTCRVQAMNSAALKDASAEITVLVRPSFSTQPTPTTVNQGNSATLYCAATGIPMPTVLWLRNGRLLTSFQLGASGGRVHQGPTGTLMIQTVTKAVDDGAYTCYANSSAGVATATVRLHVLEPPTISTSDLTVISPAVAFLPCVVSAGDPAPVIGWSYGNGTALPVTGRYGISPTGTLAIPGSTVDDEGQYLCTAMNSVGKMSAMATLTVQVRPTAEILTPGFSSIAAHVNTNLTLVCRVTGKPLPVVTWGFGVTQITNTSTSLLLGEQRDRLLLINVTPQRDGNWVCAVQTAAGSAVSTAILTVQVPPSLSPVVQRSRTSSSVEIGWSFGSNGGSVITNVSVERAEAGSTNFTTPVWLGVRTVYNATGLQAHTGYLFRVHVYNAVGPSPASVTSAFTTCSRAPTSAPQMTITTLNITTFNITWSAPIPATGPVATYLVTWDVPSNGSIPRVTMATQDMFVVAMELHVYTEYSFTVQASTRATCDGGVGQPGPTSQPVLMTTGELPPLLAPVNVTTEVDAENGIIVSWLSPPPSSVRGRLLGFTVYYRVTEKTLENYEWVTAPADMGPSEDRRYLQRLDSPKAGVSYDIKVQAYNDAGRGPNSTVVAAQTLAVTTDEGTSAGSVAGIVVGSVCGLLIIILLFLLIQNHRKSTKRDSLYDTENDWKGETASSQVATSTTAKPKHTEAKHPSKSSRHHDYDDDARAGHHDDSDDRTRLTSRDDDRYTVEQPARKAAVVSNVQAAQYHDSPKVVRPPEKPKSKMVERTDTSFAYDDGEDDGGGDYTPAEPDPQAHFNPLEYPDEENEGETHFGGDDDFDDDYNGGDDDGGAAAAAAHAQHGYHDNHGYPSAQDDEDPDTDLYSMPNKSAKKQKPAAAVAAQQQQESFFDDDEEPAPALAKRGYQDGDKRQLMDAVMSSPSNHSLPQQQQTDGGAYDDEGYEDPSLSQPRSAGGGGGGGGGGAPFSTRQAEEERRQKQQKADAKKREERDFREWQKQRAKEDAAAEKHRQKVLKEEQKRAEKAAKDARKAREKDAKGKKQQKRTSQASESDWDDFATGTPGKAVKGKKKGGSGGGASGYGGSSSMMMY